jgi:hypothetical protein
MMGRLAFARMKFVAAPGRQPFFAASLRSNAHAAGALDLKKCIYHYSS